MVNDQQDDNDESTERYKERLEVECRPRLPDHVDDPDEAPLEAIVVRDPMEDITDEFMVSDSASDASRERLRENARSWFLAKYGPNADAEDAEHCYASFRVETLMPRDADGEDVLDAIDDLDGFDVRSVKRDDVEYSDPRYAMVWSDDHAGGGDS